MAIYTTNLQTIITKNKKALISKCSWNILDTVKLELSDL